MSCFVDWNCGLSAAAVDDPRANLAAVGEFLDRWLADVASVRVGPKTLDNYRGHIELHVKPALGGVELAELSTAAIQRFCTRLHGEKGLAPASVALIYRTLRGALNVAMAWKLIRENPARGVHLPRAQTKRQQAVLSLEQLDLLFSALKPVWLDLVISIAVTTGLRRGEIAGLRWSLVDLAERLIGVERQRVRVGTEILEGTLKTKNSTRGVPLSERLRAELVKERARQDTFTHKA